jgi:hypothetical protein
MYVRFVEPRRLGEARVDAGLFGAAYRLRDDGDDTPAYLRDAIAEEIAWFCENLAAPDRFGVRTRRSDRSYAGVCWFRPGAREQLSRAHGLAALLREGGVTVVKITSRRPGDIVWRDAQQIVAIPRREDRRLFRAL